MRRDRKYWMIPVVSMVVVLTAVILSAGCTSGPAAKINDTVKIDYTATLSDGSVFDSTANKTPLEITLGSGKVIPGLDEAIIGMKPGQTKIVTIPPEKAYGAYREEMVNTVNVAAAKQSLDEMKSEGNLISGNITGIGSFLIWKKPSGNLGYLRFSNLTESTVTVDENHPLAGKTLVFDVTLVEIVKKE